MITKESSPLKGEPEVTTMPDASMSCIPCHGVTMPKLSHDVLKAEIAEGKVFAISIDTAIFYAKLMRFQDTLLQRLDQFHQRDIRVVIADVVADEIKDHLRRDAVKTQAELRKALRAHNNRWRRAPAKNEASALQIDSDASSFAQDKFDEFLRHVNGEVISTGDVPNAVEQVFTRYFANEPPFGPAEKRKYEFPDAFALIGLNSLAAKEGRTLICVSPDKGWTKYAEKSENLVCVNSLEEALSLFHAADQHLAHTIVNIWGQSEDGELIKDISREIQIQLDDLDFNIQANIDTVTSIETEPSSAKLKNISPLNADKATVIDVDGETVTFAIEVEAEIEFEATFNFYLYDSAYEFELAHERDRAVVKTLYFELTIIAGRSFEEELTLYEVYVTKRSLRIDFGNVG